MAAYFITFTTYGTRLHGDERSSVDRHTTTPGTPTLTPHAGRRYVAQQAMKGPAVLLSDPKRTLIDETIRSLALRRKWSLDALNVRTNHVHTVVIAEDLPELVMQGMKAWATRELVAAQLRSHGERLWTRHGSTRWLTNESSRATAIDYVLNRQ